MTGATIKQRCEAMTQAGNPCKAFSFYGSNPPRCHQHRAETKDASAAARAKGKALFLDAYRRTFDVNKSAQVAGYSPDALRDWRYTDPEFEADWAAAKKVCLDDLELSLFQRGLGMMVTETTRERAKTLVVDDRGQPQLVYKGDDDDDMLVVKTVTKWVADTRAAEIILKAHNPDRHRHNQHSITVGLERRPADEADINKIMNDPQTRAQLDALLDADLDT